MRGLAVRRLGCLVSDVHEKTKPAGDLPLHTAGTSLYSTYSTRYRSHLRGLHSHADADRAWPGLPHSCPATCRLTDFLHNSRALARHAARSVRYEQNGAVVGGRMEAIG